MESEVKGATMKSWNSGLKGLVGVRE